MATTAGCVGKTYGSAGGRPIQGVDNSGNAEAIGVRRAVRVERLQDDRQCGTVAPEQRGDEVGNDRDAVGAKVAAAAHGDVVVRRKQPMHDWEEDGLVPGGGVPGH